MFLVALIVPVVMYVAGVLILMMSLVVKHYRLTHGGPHSTDSQRTGAPAFTRT